tara:strand:- start:135 stop:815 length:681 start_codon:yes stop_codon:yes gene_type:complete
MKVGVLLSGSGVYDGSEIHESVLSLLSLSNNNLEYVCVAPNINQHHVVNHLNGEESAEERNVLNESSRIARGDIIALDCLDFNNLSALVIPGGFGVAKNLSDWAINNTNCQVNKEVKDLILHCIESKKPIVSLCISPVLIAKCLEGTKYQPSLSIGCTQAASDYDINQLNNSLKTLGADMIDVSKKEIMHDSNLNIITAPCYMLDSSINEIYIAINKAILKLKELI